MFNCLFDIEKFFFLFSFSAERSVCSHQSKRGLLRVLRAVLDFYYQPFVQPTFLSQELRGFHLKRRPEWLSVFLGLYFLFYLEEVLLQWYFSRILQL